MDKLELRTRLIRRATLRQLEIFEAVARLRSFSRAAESLCLTQPTVSMQIRKLAEAVGMPLLEKVGKGVFLTEAGRELYTVCLELFGTIDRFEMTVANLRGLKQGSLRVTAVTTAEYFLPRILGYFCQRYPGIDISLEVTNREHALERMRHNVDDLYICGQPPEELDVAAVPFLDNPLVVVAAADHPLASQRRVPLERIAQEPLLLREPGSGTRLAAEKFFATRGIVPRVRMELGSNEAIKQAVAGGLGISVLSGHALVHGSGGLVVLPVAGFPLRRSWYVVYPKGKQLSVVARTFLAFVVQEGKGFASGWPWEEREKAQGGGRARVRRRRSRHGRG